MTAFEKARQADAGVALEKLSAAGIFLTRADRVVCALDNADLDGALLPLVTGQTDKLLDGLRAVAFACGAGQAMLYLPAYAPDVSDALAGAAEAAGICLASGMVNRRVHAADCLLPLTAALDAADVLQDSYFAGRYVSVNGGAPVKVKNETKLGELLDFTACKAVEAGYSLLTPEEGELTAGQISLGNGVLRGIPHSECLVRYTEEKLRRYREASCGKCVFCREGLLQLQGFDKDLTEGKGKQESLSICREIGEAMRFSNPCTLGQNASLLLLDAMRKFPAEFDGHLRRKECVAGRCFTHELVYIDPAHCTGCGACVSACPEKAIDGKPGYIHLVDTFDCTVCRNCLAQCPAGAIQVTGGRPPRLPERFVPAGRFKRY